MVSRIKQLLEWQQLSPTQFADRIGVGRPVISHILSERNKPSLEVARSIKAAFPELSFDWLLNGSGDMLVSPAASVGSFAGRPVGEAAPITATPAAATAAALVAASPAPAVELVAPISSPTIPAAGQPKPAYPPLLPAAPAPGRFTPAGRNTAGNATPTSSELAAERFVVRGATQVPLAAVQPLPDSALPATLPLAPATASVPAAPSPIEAPVTAAATGTTASQAAPDATEAAATAQALTNDFSESSKAIRRIVIFYNDGSFADYKPAS